MDDIKINNEVTIPSSAMTFRFSRSSGKGGQNVNKVATKVEAFLTIEDIRASEEILSLLRERLSHKIDTKGQIHFTSQESRSQWKNRSIVLEKIVMLFTEVLQEEKERFATKPTRQSKRTRVEKKKKHSLQKIHRRKKFSVDD